MKFAKTYETLTRIHYLYTWMLSTVVVASIYFIIISSDALPAFSVPLLKQKMHKGETENR
jgi:hypothetical protein